MHRPVQSGRRNGVGNRIGALSDQIKDYFQKLGATDPTKMPNFGMLPKDEAEWQRIFLTDPARWERMRQQYLDDRRPTTQPATQPR